MTQEVVIGGLRWLVRPDTSDWNTIYSGCIGAEDEYKLGGLDLEGKLVFDIGAHVGSVGVSLASRGARVVMVEPLPANVEMIHKHLVLNGLTADVVEAAIGTNSVSTGPAGDHHEFIGNGYGLPRRDDALDVAEVTFGALVDAYGAPDIVKIDCEGGEWTIFPEPELRKVPLIVGEYHPDTAGTGYTSADIISNLPGHAVEVGDLPHFGPFRATIR